jgi:hypothetical protein
MTISSTTTKVSYAGNGSTTVFAYTFKIFEAADLEVIVRSSTGTETTKTLTTHYTVSGAGSDGGGSVTFVTAPASGETVVIRRNLALTQGTDYVENDPFPADSHEDALDRLTMISQGIQEELTRSLRIPVTDPTSIDMTLPGSATRATKALGFDSVGDPVVSTLTLAQIEAGSTDAAASATAAANSATASASSATASANSATSAAASAATAATYAGTQSVDNFNGDGSTVAFTMSSAPTTENNTMVYISGVYQQKDTYSISGTTLTFSTAPPSGTGNIEVMHLSTQPIGVDPSIGSVTTGAAGSSAAVSITSGGVLSFTIPQGDDGATGATGSTGAAGSAATVTVGSTTTGAPGSSATVTNVGSSSAATLNFTIPQGDTGTTGTAATIAVGTVTTGAPGSSATIVNGGSSSAATFDFTIPLANGCYRGDRG